MAGWGCRDTADIRLPVHQLAVWRGRGRMMNGNYLSYLQSPEWQQLRTRAMAHYGGSCVICNSRDNLQVHHRTYERLGQELITDVTVLCDRCHELYRRNLPHFYPWLGWAPKELFEGIKY